MINEISAFVKRQYKNYRIFNAYSVPILAKEAVLFPVDYLSGSGKSSNVLNIAVFITTRCNARCAMCNISGLLNNGGIQDMPLDKINSILDSVSEYKPGIILFGGEPFIRKDIIDIVMAVKRRGMSVGAFTNGTLLDENMVSNLTEERMDYIAFSLQGTRDVHDKILSIRGAYDKMVESISRFTDRKKRHTKVIIHTTICEYNINDLKNIARLGLELKADLVRFGHPTFYSPQEEAGCNESLRNIFKGSAAKATSYIYDIKGKEDVYYKNICQLKREFGSMISFSPELGDDEIRSWYSTEFKSKRKCLFMYRGLFIHPNGDVYPCESISYKMGNVFDEGFRNIWNGPKYTKFRQVLKKGLISPCARCCKL